MSSFIGRVIGTQPSTPLEFWFALAKDQFTQLDEVVALERRLPDSRELKIYGIVTDVRAMHEQHLTQPPQHGCD